MTQRQAQNVGRALCGEHGSYRLQQGALGWKVVVTLPEVGEDFPRSITIRTGAVFLHYREPENLTATTALCWPTDKPQGDESEERRG